MDLETALFGSATAFRTLETLLVLGVWAPVDALAGVAALLLVSAEKKNVVIR